MCSEFAGRPQPNNLVRRDRLREGWQEGNLKRVRPRPSSSCRKIRMPSWPRNLAEGDERWKVGKAETRVKPGTSRYLSFTHALIGERAVKKSRARQRKEEAREYERESPGLGSDNESMKKEGGSLLKEKEYGMWECKEKLVVLALQL